MDQEAQFGREFFAHTFDAVHQLATGFGVDQRDEAIPDFHANQIHLLHIVPIQLFGAIGGRGCDGGRILLCDLFSQRHEAHTRGGKRQQQEDEVGHARHDAQQGQDACRDEQGRWVGQLAGGLLGHRLGGRHTRDDDGGGQRQEEGGNLGDQAITDGQEHVNAGHFAQRQVVGDQTNGETTDDVDDQNQQAGQRVATDEFGRTIHGAEKVGFLGQLFTAFFGGFLVNHASVQVGVDGHLFARHGVQGETCVHFRDASSALGHHKEVHDHQDHEDDETHQVVACDHKLTKSGDHLARCFWTGVPLDQDHPGGGHVERQTQHGGEQQNRGKR